MPRPRPPPPLTELVRTLETDEARPLRRSSLDQVQHSRFRPYHPQGKKLPWNYRSTVAGSVTFRDLDAVAAFADRASAIEGVNAANLEWKLTRTARAKAVARVRDLAVGDALAKAKGYTRSLGCKRIEVIALADPGMLNAGVRPDVGPPVMRALAAAQVPDAGQSAMELTPTRLRITADVEARFEAS
ncbi:SIMPL domain-containing protein [Rhodococcus sp. BH2-1]|nr:SIMPL domain-containing protein [Rhodococcus sp. BH2-1]